MYARTAPGAAWRILALALAFAFTATLVVPSPAHAERTGRRIVLGAEIFVRYLYDVSYYRDRDPRRVRNDYNAFDIPRAQLSVEGVATPGLTGHVLIESARVQEFRADVDGDGDLESVESDDFGRVELIFKNVHIQWRPMLAFGIRAGMIPNAYTPVAERAWTMRFVDRAPADDHGFLGPEADLGLAVFGDFGRGAVSYEAQVTNGEGYRRTEENRHKAGAARVTFAPFDATALYGLSLTFAGRYETNDNPPGDLIDRQTDGVAMLAFSREGLFSGVSAFGMWRQLSETGDPWVIRGAGAWAGYVTPIGVGPFFRYDYLDGNASQKHGEASFLRSQITGNALPADEDEIHHLWGGVLYRPTSHFDLAAYLQSRIYTERYQGGAADGTMIDPELQWRASARLAF
ncbi:hypothetical protein K8I61_06155 [bacterium]|nr:hypothetical protein [bacterium]